ncbi:hypothetical protein [Pseudozobellia thermophila]|uniref:DUF5648 domain-containing protein n=1 Tax=Pseudozobellia thermophila TaxID=192903 RepID=A0A1M6ECF8_9FLAO|nr:hypothetical protein [Pseudozobellia thermophila]SHI83165.1 hypothetical protein SAMN04488513_10214 [Pseudozobellia thermophila]
MDLKKILFVAAPSFFFFFMAYAKIPSNGMGPGKCTGASIGKTDISTAVYVPLYRWYSTSRGDNFTTTNPAWRGTRGDRKAPDYTFSRIEGSLFNPNNPQPPGTVAVYSWYSPSRKDNFMTSDPRWRGNRGDTRTPDYRFVRLEGYAYDPDAPPPTGAATLYSWYSPDRGDNFVTTSRAWAGFKGVDSKAPNYNYVRREGYVLPYFNHPSGSYNIVPLFFHFQYDHIDADSGLPAYGSGENMQTMDTIDKAIDKLNQLMEKARGLDTRILKFVRVGVRYQQLAIDDPALLPLYSWKSARRNDQLAFAHPSWRIDPEIDGQMNPPDYIPQRKEGSIFPPDEPKPAGTVALYSWYSPSRGDNLITTNPEWDGSIYDTKAPDYHLIRKEGYIYDPTRPQPENTVALYSWYNPIEGDNLATTDHSWAGRRGDTRDSNYRFVRMEGYVATPSGCDLRSSSISIHRMDKTINILATNACKGITTSPSTIVATAGSLAHEIGHALGLFHTFDGNKNTSTAELLHRNLDPNSDDSCYIKGDRVCDTPPDYGKARPDGDLTDVVCGGIVPVPCEQLGPPCDLQESIIDGNGLCRAAGNQGLRTYDAIALGLQGGTPNNIMGYSSQEELSYEQYVRMLYYSLWRFGLKSQVPSDDKNIFKEFIFAPPATEFWNTVPSFKHQLNKPKLDSNIPMYRSSLSNNNQWAAGVTGSVGDRLLNFSLRILGSGLPGNGTEIQVSLPDGRMIGISAENLHLEEGSVVFDEIYGQNLDALRDLQPHGQWKVSLLNSGGFTPSEARLSVIGH